jgi:hypothetical protein
VWDTVDVAVLVVGFVVVVMKDSIEVGAVILVVICKNRG